MQGSLYTEQDRRQAAVHFLTYQSVEKTAELTGIPQQTISEWKNNAAWWNPLLSEVRSHVQAGICAEVTGIFRKSLDQLNERLDNGDVHVSLKSGEIIRAPVKFRDLTMAAAILFDKRQVLMNQPTSISGSTAGDQLAGALSAWMRAHKAQAKGTPELPAIEGKAEQAECAASVP